MTEVKIMKFERITSIDNPMYEKARELYNISFPSHERREDTSQEEILKDERYHFDTILDGEEFVGEVLYWDIGGFLYIEHFCILPEMRNKHYGSKALEMLRGTGLILEIDPPVTEIAKRRCGFYKRCGFHENPYRHIHPPYHKGNMGHELTVMSCPDVLTRDEYENFRLFLENVVMKDAYNE